MKTAIIITILANFIILKLHEDAKRYNKRINTASRSAPVGECANSFAPALAAPAKAEERRK